MLWAGDKGFRQKKEQIVDKDIYKKRLINASKDSAITDTNP
jgi:hypothetical protein